MLALSLRPPFSPKMFAEKNGNPSHRLFPSPNFHALGEWKRRRGGERGTSLHTVSLSSYPLSRFFLTWEVMGNKRSFTQQTHPIDSLQSRSDSNNNIVLTTYFCCIVLPGLILRTLNSHPKPTSIPVIMANLIPTKRQDLLEPYMALPQGDKVQAECESRSRIPHPIAL